MTGFGAPRARVASSELAAAAPGLVDPASLGGVSVIDGVTLVDGASFCVSRPSGDLVGDADGLYVGGRRVLSRWAMRLDGEPLTTVDCHLDDPAAATFVGRAGGPGGPTPGTGPVVVRRRRLGNGLCDDVEVRNVGDEPTYVDVEIELAADLAGALDVYHGRVPGRRGGPEPVKPQVTTTSGAGGAGGSDGPEGPTEVVLARGRGAGRAGCRLELPDEVVLHDGTLRWEAIVPARSSRSISLVVRPIAGDERSGPGGRARSAALRSGHPSAGSLTGERFERWQRGVPAIETDHHPLALALRRSAHDLGTLRVLDPEFPERAVVAAGAPWFLALHGRDALVAAWMSMVVDPDLALGTLETLARFQGADVDGRTEEQPGRIPHRLHFGPDGFRGPVSYGSVDATPLFVMLLGELRRWGLAPEVVDRLLPHADRALEWITGHGDRDGDGYVEYQRATDRGERHQGWKDSAEPFRLADGSPARGPIALAEVQGYAYAAYRARAHFAAEAGDDEAARAWGERARRLQEAFNRDFWV